MTLIASLKFALLCFGLAINLHTWTANSARTGVDVYTNQQHDQSQYRVRVEHTASVDVTSVKRHRRAKKHYRAFVGVMTGFKKPGLGADVYKDRRTAIRETWFPNSPQELKRWEDEYGIIIRFVIGTSDDEEANRALDVEAATYNDFLRIDVKEAYATLADKSRNFFRTAAQTYNADWFVKVDDDVYLKRSNLMAALTYWDSMNAGYVGCLNRNQYIERDPAKRWYEESHEYIVNEKYWLYAKGLIYALKSRAVWSVIIHNYDNLRLITNEDANMGLWMLASNVNRYEDLRLCHMKCQDTSIAVIPDYWKDPVGKDMKSWHETKECRT